MLEEIIMIIAASVIFAAGYGFRVWQESHEQENSDYKDVKTKIEERLREMEEENEQLRIQAEYRERRRNDRRHGAIT